MEQLTIEEPPETAQASSSSTPKPLPSSFTTFSKWIPLLCLAVMGAVLISVLLIHNKQTTKEDPKKTTKSADNQADALSLSSSAAASRQPRHSHGHQHFQPPLIIAPIDPEAVQQELDGLREAINDLRLNTSRLEMELAALKSAALPSTTPKPDSSEPDRLKAVQSLITTIWDELFEGGPVAINTFSPLDALSSLTTLQLLPPTTLGRKVMRVEAEEMRRWLADAFDLEHVLAFPTTESVATFSSAYIGGLLSAYTTIKPQDKSLLERAAKMADILAAEAHNPSTGVAYQRFTFANGSASGYSSTLSAVGGHHLEAVYLSALTKQASYFELSKKALTTIKEALPTEEKPLYNRLFSIDGLFAEYKVYTLFEETKHFFYGLLKAFIQSGGSDESLLEQYFQALEAVEAAGLLTKGNTTSENGSFTWARELDASLGQYSDWMAPSGCYLGGMFALTAEVIKSRDLGNLSTGSIRHPSRLTELAVEITATCTLAANRTATGLLPSGPFYPSANYRSEDPRSVNLNPDLVESYLILWRTTGDEKYRELAWQQVQALERLFSTFKVSLLEPKVEDNSSSDQSSSPSLPAAAIPSPIFLSATLKYLYLIFADGSFYPLNKWIFNPVGHPLPICGQHQLFSQCQN